MSPFEREFENSPSEENRREENRREENRREDTLEDAFFSPIVEYRSISSPEDRLHDLTHTVHSQESLKARLKALESLQHFVHTRPEVTKLVKELITHRDSAGLPIAPIPIRNQAILMMGAALRSLPGEEINSSLQDEAISLLLDALGDPFPQPRTTAVSQLYCMMHKREVYEKVAAYVDPGSGDNTPCVNFGVRKKFIESLARAVHVPYVRDVFARILAKPDLNQEVRLPALRALASSLFGPNYKLQQDDGFAVAQILKRKDSTGGIQHCANLIVLQLRVADPEKYRIAQTIAEQSLPSQFDHIFPDSRFLRELYQHCGHIMPGFECDPIASWTGTPHIYARRYVTEAALKKLWAQPKISHADRAVIYDFMRGELKRATRAKMSGAKPRMDIARSIVDLLHKNNDRTLDKEIAKLVDSTDIHSSKYASFDREKTNRILREWKEAKELREYSEYCAELRFQLRNNSCNIQYHMSAAQDRARFLKDILSIFEEPTQLGILENRSLYRLGKAFETYQTLDPIGFYRTLRSIRDQASHVSIIGLALDKLEQNSAREWVAHARTALYGSDEEHSQVLALAGTAVKIQSSQNERRKAQEAFHSHSQTLSLYVDTMKTRKNWLQQCFHLADGLLQSKSMTAPEQQKLAKSLDTLARKYPDDFESLVRNTAPSEKVRNLLSVVFDLTATVRRQVEHSEFMRWLNTD